MKLKHCPFCGSRSVSMLHVVPKAVIFRCDRCRVAVSFDGDHFDRGDERAVKLWNERASCPK